MKKIHYYGKEKTNKILWENFNIFHSVAGLIQFFETSETIFVVDS